MGPSTEEREAVRLADIDHASRWQCEILGYALTGAFYTSDELLADLTPKRAADFAARQVANEVAFKVNEKFAEVLGEWEALARSCHRNLEQLGQYTEGDSGLYETVFADAFKLLHKIQTLKGRL